MGIMKNKITLYVFLLACIVSCAMPKCPEPVYTSPPITSLTTQIKTSTLQDGLLACYSFTGNANDGSGNNIHGSLHGNLSLATDRFGNANQAYYFDGVDDYIDIYNPLLFNSTQWTYSTWVNVTSNPVTGAISYIIGIGGGGSGGAQDLLINNQYVIPAQGFETNSYEVAGVSVSHSITGSLPATNRWYHVVGVRESDTVRIYVDGVEIAKNKTLLNYITYGTASSAYIGCRSAGTRLFNGYLDDIRIYSRPLNSSEVQELYTTNVTCSVPLTLQDGVLACYSFTGNANDGSGNNIDGSLYGNPSLATDRFGNANQAYYFDGVDDYIEITNPQLYVPTEWTYSAWAKVTTNPASNSNAFIISIGGVQAVAINNNYTQSTEGFIATSYHGIGNTPSYCLSGSLPTVDTWYHVVGVRETDTVRVYVNGVQVAKVKTLSTAISYGLMNPAFIGSKDAGSGLFNGYLDDIRIYSRPLNSSEVQEIYTTKTICSGS